MKYYLCTCCGEVYKESIENSENIIDFSMGSKVYPCPKVNCMGQVIEIDDFLVSVIRNLNNLGFNTLSCCSGHSQDTSIKYQDEVRTYILFARSLDGLYLYDDLLEDISKSLPNGFKLEIDNYLDTERFIIEKTYKGSSESDCMLGIAKNCSELLEWSENDLVKVLENHQKIIDGFLNNLFKNHLHNLNIGELESEDSDNVLEE